MYRVLVAEDGYAWRVAIDPSVPWDMALSSAKTSSPRASPNTELRLPRFSLSEAGDLGERDLLAPSDKAGTRPAANHLAL